MTSERRDNSIWEACLRTASEVALHVAISADNESESNCKFPLIALIASVVGSLTLNPRAKVRLLEATAEANDTSGTEEQAFANSGLCLATSAAFLQKRAPALPH